MTIAAPTRPPRAGPQQRYLQTFAEAARLAETWREDDLRVLVYECGGGEDCALLASEYFTKQGHQIVGVSSFLEAVPVAAVRNRHPRVAYHHLDSAEFAAIGAFDVIFAMSALCLWPETREAENVAFLYPFWEFDQLCAQLDARLAEGGLIAFHNTTYCFTDSSVGERYKALRDPSGRSGFIQIFNPDGSLRTASYPYSIFQK